MVTLHWHTVLFAIVIILLVVRAFKEDRGSFLDLSFPLFMMLAVFLTLIYGGIYWW